LLNRQRRPGKKNDPGNSQEKPFHSRCRHSVPQCEPGVSVGYQTSRKGVKLIDLFYLRLRAIALALR